MAVVVVTMRIAGLMLNYRSAVPQDDPIFVVNVADCLSELSGGALPSTVHRVVAARQEPQSHVPRNCCALIVGLDPDCELRLGGKTR